MRVQPGDEISRVPEGGARSFAERAPVVENLLVKAGSDVLARSLRFAVTVLAARWLGPAAYGAFAYMLGLGHMLVQLADFGLHLHLTREVARAPARAGPILAAVLRAKLGLAVLVAAIFVVLGLVPPEAAGARGRVWLLGGALLVDAFVVLAAHVFRGFQLLRLESGVSLVGVGLGALGLVAVRAGWGAIGLAAGLFLGAAASLALAARWIDRGFVPRSSWWRGATNSEAWRALREAAPIGSAIVVSVVYFRTDVLLLGAWRGVEEVALYSSATRLVEGLMALPGIALAALFPAFTGEAVTGGPRLQRLYRRSLFGLGAVGIVAAALLYAAADALVPALYGRSYAAGSSVLRILAPAVPLLCVNFALTHFLVALGLSCWNLALSALYLMTNLGANLLLVPARGMYGAAVAKLLTEVVLLASAYPLIHRRLEKAPP